ncbi:MAG: hypothetical protein GX415_01595 [Chloroflexi bacterium]|nr:right-handed parallel beta-helix repeat-containing protein [Anaerolineaceae bacterium]NLI44102.1 hypothetical protein [Chloroflexota bacterium]HOE35157.1 right-handed parallel beta-helix repeat-containing protein [Anaerolineaceae bacterium]HOT26291.1 right-handed parallel beta-helix repeat-containing protein [Anaerolineaceae bacterium]HQK04269.1 right-handed parallel beta-helix repeat-containing protein [Anaerolineaceae bacterium]
MKTQKTLARVFCAVFLVVLCMGFPTPVRAGVTYTVTNSASSGAGSLRQAILDANAHAGLDTIAFDIPTSDPGYSSSLGVWVIRLTLVLPMLEDPAGVFIDGTTQTGSNPDLPGIIIEHTPSVPPGADLLTIISHYNVIKELGLFNSSGDGIVIEGDKNVILNNQVFMSAGHGISLLSGSEENDIDGNAICGHELDGIHLNAADHNVIDNNIIGVQPAYVPAVGRNQGSGIGVLGSTDNTIRANVLSNNMDYGLYLYQSSANQILENTIGMDSGRALDLGNDLHGVFLLDSPNNVITCNWISGNGNDGLRISGNLSTDNILQQNWVGTAHSGPIPNAHHGISIYNGASQNTIGSDSSEELGNVVYGNGWSGIVVVNSPLGANMIGFNSIYSHDFYGIHINNSPGNYIVSNRIAGNGIQNDSAGVRVENSSGTGEASDNNLIWSNQIFNNHGKGIQLVGDANNNIASPVILSASCSLVSGTACPGCWVQVFSDLYEEGRSYEALTTADGSGHFSAAINAEWPNITAVAIDGPGNSSEFSLPASACFRLFLPALMK